MHACRRRLHHCSVSTGLGVRDDGGYLGACTCVAYRVSHKHSKGSTDSWVCREPLRRYPAPDSKRVGRELLRNPVGGAVAAPLSERERARGSAGVSVQYRCETEQSSPPGGRGVLLSHPGQALHEELRPRHVPSEPQLDARVHELGSDPPISISTTAAKVMRQGAQNRNRTFPCWALLSSRPQLPLCWPSGLVAAN